MRIARYIMHKSLFFELCINENEEKVRVWNVYYKSETVWLEEWKTDYEEGIRKWKYVPTLLLITSEAVINKRLQTDDHILQRITDNKELLWEISEEPDGVQQNISFLRKEKVDNLTNLLSRHHIPILKTWIRKTARENEKDLISDFYEKQLKASSLFQNIPLSNTLSLLAYQKLRLPVLLCIFIVALANFGLNNHLRKEYEKTSAELQTAKRHNKDLQANPDEEGSLFSQYQSERVYPSALMADRIASYVPQQLILTSLKLFTEGKNKPDNHLRKKQTKEVVEKIIFIKGETSVPGCVSLFSQSLENDKLFKDVTIKSLLKKSNSPDFTFELVVEPEQIQL